MILDEAHAELRAAMRDLFKARRKAGEMHPDHKALHDHIAAVADHPRTRPEVRLALFHILNHSKDIAAASAPKPRAPRTPKPAPALDHALVEHHATGLRAELGTDRFGALHATVAAHPTAHVHAVARAFTGGVGRSKKASLALIMKHHNVLVGARARAAARDGRTAG